MLTIGTHMSIAKGWAVAAQNVVNMNANTMQIFSRNPRGSNFRTPSVEEAKTFQRLRREHHFGPLLAHAPYTLNLASSQAHAYDFACIAMREDIKRMDDLGIEYLVFHPGSHTGLGSEAGIQKIIDGLNQAISADQSIMVLLETMSGKGTEIGWRFEELKAIRDGFIRWGEEGGAPSSYFSALRAASSDTRRSLRALISALISTARASASALPFAESA